LAAFADALGYSDGQGTVSLWEKGARPVPSGKFPQIVELLGLPDSYLVNPPETDPERLEADQRAASALEQRDWEAGLAPDLGADDGPDDEPGTPRA
jgi:transcriptional regulator with XRE-family HTH domain